MATLPARGCPSTAPTLRSCWHLRCLPPSGGPLAKCSGLVAWGLGQDSLGTPGCPSALTPAMWRGGPRNTHHSLNLPLNISWQKHPYNLKNQLSSSLLFTNLHDTGQGCECDLSSGDGGDTVPSPPSRGHEELLKLEAGDTGSACDLEKDLEPRSGPHSLTH